MFSNIINFARMSTGTILKSDGQLIDANTSREYPEGHLEGADYLIPERRDDLRNFYNLPEAAVIALNRVIGYFAKAMMEASLVDGQVAKDLAVAEVPRPGLNSVTTLSAVEVGRVFRRILPEAMYLVIDSLSDEQKALFDDYEALLQAITRPDIRMNKMIHLGGEYDEAPLDVVQLMDPAIATMIDEAFESGVAEAIESALKRLGGSILSRARLSQPSFSHEVRKSEQFFPRVEEGTKYSTLDVNHLIGVLKDYFRTFIPGLAMSLPDETRNKVLQNGGEASSE